MSTFFALLPSQDIQQQITEWRDRALPPFERPVHAANLHLTLAFLGKIEPWHFEPLVMQSDAVGFEPFDLHLDEMGYWSKAGVAWLGASEQPPQLENLVTKLNAIARALNLPQDKRRYKAHLTFARKIKKPPPAPTLEPDFQMRFDGFVLMQTRQQERGVRYEVMEEFS